jgi:hypothetical protein
VFPAFVFHNVGGVAGNGSGASSRRRGDRLLLHRLLETGWHEADPNSGANFSMLRFWGVLFSKNIYIQLDMLLNLVTCLPL